MWVARVHHFSLTAFSVGHKGRYGHEFLEFEFRSDGKLRYVNNSHYKEDVIIRKEGQWLQFDTAPHLTQTVREQPHASSCALHSLSQPPFSASVRV